VEAADQARYAYLFCAVLLLGVAMLYVGVNRIGNDPLSLRRPERSWDLPFLELAGAFISGLAGGGLLGLLLFRSAWVGTGIGLVIGTVAVGWTFARRSQEWDVRSIEDTMQRPPGLGDFVGEQARALEAIAAGGTGAVSVVGPEGDRMAVIAVADADVAQGATVTITGRRGLNLVVVPDVGEGRPGGTERRCRCSETLTADRSDDLTVSSGRAA